MKTSARAIALALGGQPAGSGWVARCPVPAHPDAKPSLWITECDGKVLVRCRSRCTQSEVIAELRRRGLWGGRRAAQQQVDEPAPVETTPRRDPLRAWRDGVDFRNTIGELYLAHRGLLLSDVEADALRFHPRLYHWPSGLFFPTMIALVRADGVAITCHQTFIDQSGRGKAAVEKPRLYPAGTSPAGGGVWFGEPDPAVEFIVGEGIESLLSALRLRRVQAGVAALCARGITQLRLPERAQRIVVFADNDSSGLEAAWARCRYWRAEGRNCQVAISDNADEDANDLLLKRGSAP